MTKPFSEGDTTTAGNRDQSAPQYRCLSSTAIAAEFESLNKKFQSNEPEKRIIRELKYLTGNRIGLADAAAGRRSSQLTRQNHQFFVLCVRPVASR
jgi:hypothetical protein